MAQRLTKLKEPKTITVTKSFQNIKKLDAIKQLRNGLKLCYINWVYLDIDRTQYATGDCIM